MTEEAALDRLRVILGRPEYNVHESVPWWQQLLQPLFDVLWRLVGDLWELILATASGREGSIGIVVAISAVLLLGAVSVYLARAVRLSVIGEDALRQASLAERRERSDHLWNLAQRLAAEGQLPEAVRALYLSTLYALDEQALLHVEQNLTNREHAARLRARDPSLAANFAELVERYERIRYGHAVVPPESFEELTGRAERVRTAALAPAA